MRELLKYELSAVSGAGVGDPVPHDNRDGGKWGNNGFGNGADANTAAPGNSGQTGGGKEGSLGDARGPR